VSPAAQTAYERVIDALGPRVRRHNTHQATALCPAHDDHDPSLSVTHSGDRVLLNCQTGCDPEEVVAEIGLTMADLFDQPHPNGTKPTVIARYTYTNADSQPLFTKIRLLPKDFRVEPAGIVGKLERKPLYRLPELLQAIKDGTPIYIVEGEKDADRLHAIGHVATCNYDGAAKNGQRPKWRSDYRYADYLTGADVTIIADRDDAGLAHAAAIRADLTGRATSIRIVQSAVTDNHADVSDHLAAGYTLDQLVPIDLEAVPPVDDEPDQPPPPKPFLFTVEDGHTLTDDGNALRLIDAHHHELRYAPQRGGWLHWTGHRWAWDQAGTVHEHARHIARDLPLLSKAEEKHKEYSLSARALANMVRVAQTDPRIVAHADDLDRRPYELNTPSGIVDLRTATIHPADPAALHTRTTAVDVDLDSKPKRWLDFLAETFAGDPELTTYVQRLLGVSLLGVVLEQLLPFAYGVGANGKTTLLDVAQHVIGIGDEGYSISAPAEMLLATTHQGHPTEIARLSGARLVVTSELEEGQRFAEARVKQLTGRDAISGRFMRQDWFTFTPTHTLWLLANHQPHVRSGGPAFWRRLRLLPFLHTVPTAHRDPALAERLIETEGPQILGWLIHGCANYLTSGLGEPESVQLATEAYAKDQDTVTRFVEECCETGSHTQQGMAAPVPKMRTEYETWCRNEGESPLSARGLTMALTQRFGVVSHRSRTSRHYLGIRILSVTDDEAIRHARPDPRDEDEPQEDRFW